MRHHLVAAVLILAAVCGCAPIERQTVFIEREYIPYGEEGTSSIVGQAFLRTSSGDVKFGAGLPVILTPVTSYSAEWFKVEILGGRRLAAGDPREMRYARSTICDAEGRFAFTNIPPGNYYLTCDIYWEIDDEWSGDTAYAIVEVGPDKSVKAIVTRSQGTY